MEGQMDRLEAMSVFVTAVETGSLSAASRKLGVPLATVSRKVSQLETHLRTRLINRTSRRLTLTDAGRSYVVACKQILENVNEAERAAGGEYATPKGDLTITAPVVFGRLHVLPVVLDFLKTHSDINVQLDFSNHLVNLQDNHVDIAVRVGDLPDSRLLATRIGTIRRVVCGSPAYFSERGKPRAPRDLIQPDCITSTFGGLASPDVWIFDTGKTKVSVTVRSRLVANAESADAATIAGLGITRVLSFQVASSVRNGALVLVLREFESTAIPVNFIHAGQGPVPLKIRAFLDFATPRLKATLS